MKNKTSKLFFILFLILLVGVIIAYVVHSIATDGYFFVGEGWRDDPESALIYAIKNELFIDEDALAIATLIDINYFADRADILYVSASDTLVTAVCVKNDKGKWHFYGMSEESDLNNPWSFILNGDNDQEIMAPCHPAGNLIYGWKLSNTPTLYVNGVEVQSRTLKFNIKNKEWSIDYWWIDLPDADMDNIVWDFD